MSAKSSKNFILKNMSPHSIIPVVVLDSVIIHTSAWFLDREMHQLVKEVKGLP